MRLKTGSRYVCVLSGTLLLLCAARAIAAPTLDTIASFNGTNGSFPRAALMMDSSGNIFGTTELGGASSKGTIFEIAEHTSTINSLASFNGGSTGGLPIGGVVADSSGNLYGTTEGNGANSDGTVFELPAGSGTITTIASFNGTNGAHPYGSVTFDTAGNMYGTTELGGTNTLGNVFKVAAHSTTLTNLAAFDSTMGNEPQAGLIMDSAGNLYGTTGYGGATGNGTIFKIAAGTSTITTLASFTGNAGGANPYASLVRDTAGNLFGTTGNGGTGGVGTVFELPAGSSTITVLTSTVTGSPEAGLIEDAAGNLFGTTFNGGASSNGSVFELAKGASSITTLISFNGSSNGQYPYAALIADSSGNLYGVTTGGGANSDGTVFEVTGSEFVVVPETSSLVLGGLALAGLLAVQRHKQRCSSLGACESL